MAADPPPEEFGVAEERSGHCAVVDGNCLYVWGGYVVRKLGSTGKPKGWTKYVWERKRQSRINRALETTGGGGLEKQFVLSRLPPPRVILKRKLAVTPSSAKWAGKKRARAAFGREGGWLFI